MRALYAELGGAADIRVVAAEDHDRVAPRLDRAIPFHDPPEAPIRVGVHVVVGDADASSAVRPTSVRSSSISST